MRRTLAVMLMVVAGAAAAPAQNLEVHLTQSESAGALRAGALYTARPIGEWLYFDLAIEAFVRGDLRPHRDIYLVGPDGTRLALPDLRTYRSNREAIREVFGAIATSEAAGVFPIARQFKSHCGSFGEGRDRTGCTRYPLWRFDVGPVITLIPFLPREVVLTELLFQAPTGGWAAGDYVLTIDGPGDSVTRLPVRIG